MSTVAIWMEEWIAQHKGTFIGPEVYQRQDAGGVATGYTLARFSYVHDDERAALAAAAPALARALLQVEWQTHDGLASGAPCACCSARANDCEPHDPGCQVDAALTAAGFPDQVSRDAARAMLRAR